MTHEEFQALSWWESRRPTNLVSRWRELGRQWALLGEFRSSEVCHGIADWWARPFWARFFDPWTIRRLERERDRLSKERVF